MSHLWKHSRWDWTRLRATCSKDVPAHCKGRSGGGGLTTFNDPFQPYLWFYNLPVMYLCPQLARLLISAIDISKQKDLESLFLGLNLQGYAIPSFLTGNSQPVHKTHMKVWLPPQHSSPSRASQFIALRRLELEGDFLNHWAFQSLPNFYRVI